MRDILRFLLVLAAVAGSVYAVGNHGTTRGLTSFTFKPPFFPDAGMAAVPGWEVKGSTEVQESLIRLTSAEKDTSGYIVNRRPYFLSTVELTLAFRIHSDNHLQGADGLALWMTDQPLKSGDCMGVSCLWNGIAVFFDTYDNNLSGDNPRISVHHNDGTHEFEFHADGRNTELIGCKVDYRNAPISYLHLFYENGALNVFVDDRGDGNWKRCGPAYEIALPRRYFFGLSAATGGLYDNHDVIALDVSTMDAKKTEEMMKPDDIGAVDDIADFIRAYPREETGSLDASEPTAVDNDPSPLAKNPAVVHPSQIEGSNNANIGEQIPVQQENPIPTQQGTDNFNSNNNINVNRAELEQMRQQLEQKTSFIQSQDLVIKEMRNTNAMQEAQLGQREAEVNRLQSLVERLQEENSLRVPNAECDPVKQKDEVAATVTDGLQTIGQSVVEAVQESIGHSIYETHAQVKNEISSLRDTLQAEISILRAQVEGQREIISRLAEQATVNDVSLTKNKKMDDKMDGFMISMSKIEKSMLEVATLGRETTNSLQHLQRYVSNLPATGAPSRDSNYTIPGVRTAILIITILVIIGIVIGLIYLIKQCRKPIRRYGSSLYS